MKKILIFTAILFLAGAEIFGITAFTGLAGAKLNYSADQESDSYDPMLKLQAFFAGQFNFTQNVWSHLEFSLDTDNFLNEDIFDRIPARFKVDEVSITARANLSSTVNYLSAFVGSYEPIGSDILLCRYFGIESISSKITDSWLGTGNSALYAHFGIGVADLLKFHNFPGLIGTYIYVNDEDEDDKVLNFDLRGALSLHYFTIDAAAGIGAPLSDENGEKDVILAVDKLYWHAGTTFLLGNNYTAGALFAQIGINNASIEANDSATTITPETCYFLIEPRFYSQSSHFHLTFYSLPQDTVEDLMLLDNTLGVNMNIFKNLESKKGLLTIGFHLNAGFEDTYFDDLNDLSSFSTDDFNVSLIPYFSTQILTGTLNTSFKVNFSKFSDDVPGKAFSIDLGYKCKL